MQHHFHTKIVQQPKKSLKEKMFFRIWFLSKYTDIEKTADLLQKSLKPSNTESQYHRMWYIYIYIYIYNLEPSLVKIWLSDKLFFT